MHYQQTILWNKAMSVASMVVQISGPLNAANEFPISHQLRQSAFDLVRFIADGWTRESRVDKAHYMGAAQGSLAELVTQILLCERAGWIDNVSTETLHATMDEVGRMLSSIRKRLRGEQSLIAAPVTEMVSDLMH